MVGDVEVEKWTCKLWTWESEDSATAPKLRRQIPIIHGDALYHAADPDDEEARDGMLTLSSPAKSG